MAERLDDQGRSDKVDVPTPRTDALAETFHEMPNWHAIVDAAVEHAKTLERELAALGADYGNLLKESTEELRVARSAVVASEPTKLLQDIKYEIQRVMMGARWDREHFHLLLERITEALSARSASERIVWPKEKFVGRMGEMAPRGDMTLMVALQDDGDVVVEVHQTRHSQYQYAQTEFCTPGQGGGKSPRTREALIALMVAIEADNAASPDRAWPPKDRATSNTTDSRVNK